MLPFNLREAHRVSVVIASLVQTQERGPRLGENHITSLTPGIRNSDHLFTVHWCSSLSRVASIINEFRTKLHSKTAAIQTQSAKIKDLVD